jgi:hypothetical protein
MERKRSPSATRRFFVSNIWLPGVGAVPAHIRTAQQAVEAYDSRLELGYDERNKQWVVLWKDAVDGAPYPVMGLGRELPSYEEIQRILYQGDTVRRGGKLIQEINRRQAQRRADSRQEVNEAAGEVAEALEYAFRKMGKTSYQRIFIPKGI